MRAEKTGRVELDRLHNSVKLVEKKSVGLWDLLGGKGRRKKGSFLIHG
jgi:hypothetical protein